MVVPLTETEEQEEGKVSPISDRLSLKILQDNQVENLLTVLYVGQHWR